MIMKNATDSQISIIYTDVEKLHKILNFNFKSVYIEYTYL